VHCATAILLSLIEGEKLMASDAYLKIKGTKHGEVKGSVTRKGREGAIMVIAAAHEIISPRDATSETATDKRLHKPFIITKELDKASPVLYEMLVTNEIISEWQLQFWASSKAGEEIQRYTVKLTNASISDISFRMPNTKVPETAKLSEYEEVSFNYQKIEWIWVDGGISAQDNFKS
jgi:type VI secretion system secreted protein Hcp